MPLERARYDVSGQTLIVVALPDRRGARADQDTLWCFQKTLECCLYGSNSSAIHRLLERCSCLLYTSPSPRDAHES
eukprot:4601017-Prymnesium_polylepis.1